MYRGKNPDGEDNLIEWIDEKGENNVIEILAKRADEMFGGKPVGERPSCHYEQYDGHLSRNVKRRGFLGAEGEYEEQDLYDMWDMQAASLNESLEKLGLSLDVQGRMGGHWCIVGDIYETIDGLFDYVDVKDGFEFYPNDDFNELNQKWDDMIKHNESSKTIEALWESRRRREFSIGSILKEGAALEHLKAIASGEESPITAADVAPANPDPSIEYEEEKDPEMMEGTPNKISESINRLMEAGMTDAAKIRGFMMSAGPKSYDAFLASKFGDDAINEGKFKTYVSNQMKRGDYALEPDEEAAIFAKKVGGGGPRGKGDDSDKFFTVPEMDPNYKKSARLSGYEKRFAGESMDPEASSNADAMFINMTDIVADIAAGVATKRHALIFGDPGVGKTYECTRALEGNLNHDRYEMKYYKGNVGKSMTACAAFFYKYSQNYVIMLDDNDAMLMKSGVSQQVKLFFKALLDPDAVGQPIAVPTTVLKAAGAAMEALDAEAKPMKKKEGVRIDIDRARLREGRLTVFADGREAIDTFIPLDEANDLLHMTYDPKERRLTEKRNGNKYLRKPWQILRERDEDEDDDEFISDEDLENAAASIKRGRRSRDDDDDYDPNAEELDPNQMPSSFIFNSSVIFISNLEKADIDEAIWDRFTTARIALNPMEFMDRLGKIYPKLGNVNPLISSVPQEYVDWAKKSTLGVMEGIVEAWQSQTPLLGVTVKIPRRTLTYRLFSDFVEFFLRTARSYDRSTGGRGGNFKDRAYQQKVAENVELPLLKFALKKIVFGE